MENLAYVILFFIASTNLSGIEALSIEAAVERDKTLGQGFYLPNFDLQRSVLPSGSTIFKPFPSSCFHSEDLSISKQDLVYFSNTTSIMSSLGASAGLSPSFLSIFSLGATLRGMIQHKTGNNYMVKGTTLNIYSLSRQDYLAKNCLNRQDLDGEFVTDFQQLDREITNPEKRSSWINYEKFLKKYGTHFVQLVKYGSSLSQNTFAQSSEKYSFRNFSIKACADLAGPVNIGKLGVSLCGGISKDESDLSRYFDMSNKLVLKGGTSMTRNKLSQFRTRELIQKFMDEGQEFNTPVSYKFQSIPELLESRFYRSSYMTQVFNLKAFLEGYLNFGCGYKTNDDESIVYQKFSKSEQRSSVHPVYVCSLAHEGCRMDADCHRKLFRKCVCDGSTCVRHDEVTRLNGNTKRKATINRDPEWQGPRCSRDSATLWFSCFCNTSKVMSRRITWSSDRDSSSIIGAFQKYFTMLIQKLLN